MKSGRCLFVIIMLMDEGLLAAWALVVIIGVWGYGKGDQIWSQMKLTSQEGVRLNRSVCQIWKPSMIPTGGHVTSGSPNMVMFSDSGSHSEQN